MQKPTVVNNWSGSKKVTNCPKTRMHFGFRTTLMKSLDPLQMLTSVLRKWICLDLCIRDCSACLDSMPQMLTELVFNPKKKKRKVQKKCQKQQHCCQLSPYLKSYLLLQRVGSLPWVTAQAPESQQHQPVSPLSCWPGRHCLHDARAASQSEGLAKHDNVQRWIRWSENSQLLQILATDIWLL